MKKDLQLIQNTFLKVEKLFSEKQIPELATELLEICGTAFRCQWGTLWLVDSKVNQLRPVSTWTTNQFNAKKLKADTEHRSLSLSEGNAGHVWRSRKPIWTDDLIRDMCIPRSLDAESVGLHGGIWFALKTESAVYGVMELLGTNLPVADDEMLATIELLGINIGRSIEQRPVSE